MIKESEFVRLAAEILPTHSPSGNEEEIDRLLLQWFGESCDECWQDNFGNVIGLIRGKSADDPLKILAHKDEIGYAVKRIQEDGLIRVDSCGSIFPWKHGEMPVDILGRNREIKGVLSMGALHTSPGGHPVREFLEKRPVLLSDTYVRTTLSREELLREGIHPGTRITVAREFKAPIRIGSAIAGYGLDNKLAIIIMHMVASELRQRPEPPERNIYFIATSMEEVGSHGAVFAARALPGNVSVALEIGPVAEEYDVKLNDQPVIWYGPGGQYSKRRSDAVLDLAQELGFGAQPAYIWGAGSDSAKILQMGLAAEALCLAFPCDNTHGYEIADVKGCLNTATLLREAILRSIL